MYAFILAQEVSLHIGSMGIDNHFKTRVADLVRTFTERI